MLIPVLTSKAPQMAAPLPSLPPPLPAKPTPPQPSKWWTLLLIIPAIATGLAVVASQFLRRRWTNWQARLAGHLDLLGRHHAVVTPRVEASPDRSDFAKLGETIAASLVVQAAQAAITPAPCSDRPSSPLTTFDSKSLKSREMRRVR